MKRGGPIRRKVGLQPGQSRLASRPPVRTRPDACPDDGHVQRKPTRQDRRAAVRRALKAAQPRDTRPTPETVALVLARAEGSCELCGRGLSGTRGWDWSISHRLPRGNGGTSWPGINLPSNLMLLCGSGTTGCHGLIEGRERSWAYAVGLLLRHRPGVDPATLTTAYRGGVRVQLDDDGGMTTAPGTTWTLGAQHPNGETP